MSSAWTPYTNTQAWTDGKVIDQTQGANAVSPQDEFDEIENKLGDIPAITDATTDLKLLNGLDFNKTGNIVGVQGFQERTFNVAQGWGVGTANIISAIQAAIDNGGGIVEFGPETFSVEAEINASDFTGSFENVIFVGTGRDTVLEFNHTSAGDMFDLGGVAGFQFHNMTFTYGAAASAAGRYINNAGANFVGRNLWFSGGTNMDGALGWATGQTNSNCNVQNLYWTGECDNRVIICTRLRGAYFSGIDIDVSSGTPLQALYFDENSGSNEDVTVNGFRCIVGAGTSPALEVDAANTGRITISNIQISSGVAHTAIKLGTSGGAGADNVTIHGGHILQSDTAANGIDASEVTKCVISGVTIDGGGSGGTGEGIRVDNGVSIALIGNIVTDYLIGIDDNGNTGTSITTQCIVAGNGTADVLGVWTNIQDSNTP